VHAADPVKVVHLVIGGDVAGGQMVALHLALAARESDDDVSFVSPSAGPFVDLARRHGLAVEIVPLGGALDIASLVRLTRSVRGANILHTHAHFSLNALGRIAGRLAGARVIAHMHIENVFRAGPGRRAQVLLDNATARLCAAIVAVSDATRANLIRQGYPAGRVVTIHNGVEPAAPVDPLRLAEGPIVLEVARLAPVKGQEQLIRALDRVDATAVLVGRDLEGDGRYEDELRRLAKDARVVFAGYRDDVPALLAGCDVFCLPSTIEGLPLVVLEAMAHAKPVVATAVGGTPELVVDGETGVLVPPGDVGALADALDGLLRDPRRAHRMGRAGLARVRAEFDAETLTARVLSLYSA
jgi:glycosyltransferase involved in cell wall biosynthesis